MLACSICGNLIAGLHEHFKESPKCFKAFRDVLSDVEEEEVIEPMSDIKLSAIEGRATSATEGDWGYWLEPFAPHVNYWVGTYDNDNPEVAKGMIEEDADFISHARTDVPLLLAEVHRLRNLIGEALKEWPGGDYLTAKPHKALDVAIYMHEALTDENGAPNV